MKNYCLFIILCLSFLGFSQTKQDTSVIKGNVIDEATGKYIQGINVKIVGTKIATSTDTDGVFTFRNAPIGKLEFECTSLIYDTKIISDIEIIRNETTNLTISMSEKNNKLNEVVIKRTKMKAESIASLMAVQKNSSRVQDGISAETIKRTPDRTTSDVLRRISGASIQDNKFVIIRGLNDRYNTSYLNGAPLPSSEPDRKAFSFDIFPANMLDNLVIYKTASADLSGEFAGGVIDINTKATPDKNFQSLTIGAGFNEITTGKEQIYAQGGNTDWLGIDGGTRALPNYIPNVQEFQQLQVVKNEVNATKINDLSKNYQTDWSLKEKSFAPNTNFQYTLGRFIKMKNESNLGFLFSLSHSKNNNFNETSRNTYETPQTPDTKFFDKRYAEQVLFGGIANVSFKLDNNNNFSFKNLYSINSNNRIIERTGLINVNDQIFINNSSRLFTSNNIYAGQLAGEHYIATNKIKINWVGSFSMVERNTPNDRINTYSIIPDQNIDGQFLPPTAYFTNQVGFDSPGFQFSAKNEETIHNGKLDISKKLKLGENSNLELKTGFYNQSRNRKFAARQLGYVPFNGTVNGKNYSNNTFEGNIATLPNETIFNSGNMGVIDANKSGLALFDGTRPNDTYIASSDLDAGYLMFDANYKKIRAVAGVRLESYSQRLDSKLDNGQPVVVDDKRNDYLPSVNLIYGIDKKQNLRFSFSKTLNRPEFRELAPFLFFNAETRFNEQGNRDLKICSIENFDFRYEYFPGKGQLFSISAFYKKFKDPIELQALANNSNKYQNAESATNKGIEIEFRTLLGSIFSTENKLLNDFTLYSNVSIIRSKVNVDKLFGTSNLEDVPLQGQSPYVFNAGLQYINKESGWTSSLNINRIGNRIAIQSNQTSNASNPALWEKSRTFFDGQITKSFLKNTIELKLNIQNILKQDLVFYLNNDLKTDEVKGIDSKINDVFVGDKQNKNGYQEGIDDLVWVTKFGRTFSFSLSYNF